MPATYQPIETKTLASTAASVVFSSIPQTYTDLILVSSVKATNTSGNRAYAIQYNNDASSLYSDTDVYGEITTRGSFRRSNGTRGIIGEVIGNNGNPFSTVVTQIMDYSNTTTNKTALSRGGEADTADFVYACVILYRSTNAITSITVFPTADNFASGSTFTLYGVKAG